MSLFLQNFFHPGRVLQGIPSACLRRCGPMHTRPRMCLLLPETTPQSPAFLPAFSHGFPAVARMTKALQVIPGGEHSPVPLMRLDVVYIRGSCSVPWITWRIPLCALPAKRLTQKLRRPQVLCPLIGGIHPVPAFESSLRLALSFGLWAVQYPSDTRTLHPGCRHGRSGFCAIGLSPPGKNKSAQAIDTPFQGLSHGSGAGR